MDRKRMVKNEKKSLLTVEAKKKKKDKKGKNLNRRTDENTKKRERVYEEGKRGIPSCRKTPPPIYAYRNHM